MLKYSSLLLILLMACGAPGYDIDKNGYEPKIVIEGYLIPNETVHKIKITRNFPLQQGTIDKSKLPLKDAEVKIKEMPSGSTITLTFDTPQNAFTFTDASLPILPNKTYRLEVTATIDGTMLHATSETTVPQSGFAVDSVSRKITKYRERSGSQELLPFDINIKLSPNAEFYLVAQKALAADTSNFIYDNPYFDIDPKDVMKDLPGFKYQTWEFENLTGSNSKLPIQWWAVNFYSQYKTKVYAGDKNYKDFFLTFDSVEDIDGTLYEPVFHIQGDGIGVFGSAIVDSVVYEVIR